MKKLFLIPLASLAIYYSANAQSPRFGFTAGTTFANYHSKVDGESDNGNSITGFTAGVLVDIPIGKTFSFQPAVNFIQKGTKDEQTDVNYTETIKLTVNCIEVPLNFLYNAPGKKGNFFIGAGPSFAFAISGKWKFDNGTDSFSESIDFGSDDNDFMKGFDFGANFLTGYNFKNGLQISANYNAGLSNLAPGGSADGTLKSSYFGIKLGYILKGKAQKLTGK